MAKLTEEQIETELNALVHGDFQSTLAVWEMEPTDALALARQAFTLGRDQGTAETIERAVNLLGSPIGNEQAMQIARSVATIVQWCDEGDVSLECRSYSARRTVFTDPERKWCASGASISEAYPVCHYGASHAEALARLATWCGERLNHDEKTEPTGYGDALSQVAR